MWGAPVGFDHNVWTMIPIATGSNNAAVFLLGIPEIYIESLDEYWISYMAVIISVLCVCLVSVYV